MNETERRKDKSTAEIEKSLRYLKIKLTRSIREPKFVLEVVTLIIFIGYAIYTGRMYYANRDAADAAKSAADTAKDTLIASNRPWLFVRPVIAGPLTFDKEGGHITIDFITSNVGHSPAVRVQSTQEFIQVIIGIPNPWQEIKNFCAQASGQSALPGNRGLSQTIFPGIDQKERVGLTLSTAEMNRKTWNGWKPPFIYPVVVWCSAYQASFSGSVFHTGFAWQLVKKDSMVPNGIALIDPAKGALRVQELQILPYPFIGPLAD